MSLTSLWTRWVSVNSISSKKSTWPFGQEEGQKWKNKYDGASYQSSLSEKKAADRNQASVRCGP